MYIFHLITKSDLKKKIKSLRANERNATILCFPLSSPSTSMPTATLGCQKEKPLFSFRKKNLSSI